MWTSWPRAPADTISTTWATPARSGHRQYGLTDPAAARAVRRRGWDRGDPHRMLDTAGTRPGHPGNHRPAPRRRHRRCPRSPSRRLPQRPTGTVSPGGRRRAPRQRGHARRRLPGAAAGGGTPDGGPAVLGRPGDRPGHRYGTMVRLRPPSPCQPRSARPSPRDSRTSNRHGRHNPHRRRSSGRDAAARHGQPTRSPVSA
jgi:hypothetical protein